LKGVAANLSAGSLRATAESLEAALDAADQERAGALVEPLAQALAEAGSIEL
jgi:HPt (histidine-containing phosphotransfer) domain-containing protein